MDMFNGGSLYMLPEKSHTQMMGFLFKTKSGKLIAIDGGNTADGENLVNAVKELSVGEPKIDAYFITHAHSDHIGAITYLLNESDVKVDKFYFNFPTSKWVYDNEKAALVALGNFLFALAKRKIDIVTVRSGDVFEFDSVKVKVLSEPIDEIAPKNMNNTSVVYKFITGNKDILFLGDAEVDMGHKIMKAFPEDIKDVTVCQMSHHGQKGVDEKFYKLVNPEICLWCAPDWLYDNNFHGEGYDTGIWDTVITRGWMEKIGVKTHYVTKNFECVFIPIYCVIRKN